MNIVKAERDAKIDAIATFLDAIYKQERELAKLPPVAGWVTKWTAELMLEKLEQIEVEAEERWFASREAEHDEKAPI